MVTRVQTPFQTVCGRRMTDPTFVHLRRRFLSAQTQQMVWVWCVCVFMVQTFVTTWLRDCYGKKGLLSSNKQRNKILLLARLHLSLWCHLVLGSRYNLFLSLCLCILDAVLFAFHMRVWYSVCVFFFCKLRAPCLPIVRTKTPRCAQVEGLEGSHRRKSETNVKVHCWRSAFGISRSSRCLPLIVPDRAVSG